MATSKAIAKAVSARQARIAKPTERAAKKTNGANGKSSSKGSRLQTRVRDRSLESLASAEHADHDEDEDSAPSLLPATPTLVAVDAPAIGASPGRGRPAGEPYEKITVVLSLTAVVKLDRFLVDLRERGKVASRADVIRRLVLEVDLHQMAQEVWGIEL